MNETTTIVSNRKINALPNELLTEIFILTVDSLSDKQFLTKEILLFVCRRWHSILISTPSFWTKLHIFPPNAPSEEGEFIIRLKLLSERAGMLPLHVVWDQPPNISYDIADKLSTVIPLYAPIGRWKELTIIRWNDSAPIMQIPATNKQRFGMLSSLYLYSKDVSGRVFSGLEQAEARPVYIKLSEIGLPRLFRHGQDVFTAVTEIELYSDGWYVYTSLPLTVDRFPALRKLRMQSIDEELWASPPQLQRSIPQLHFKLVSMSHLSKITMLNVEHLHIDQLYTDYSDVPVPLPTLKLLEIHSGELWSLHILRAPNLEELRLGEGMASSRAVTQAVEFTLEESIYSLSPITLVLNTPVRTKVLAQFLKRSEHLEHISFFLDKRACKKVEDLVSIFKRPQTDNRDLDFVSPQLRSLHLKLCWDQVGSSRVGLELVPPKSWGEIAHSILSARAGTPLTIVTCEWADGYKIDIRTSAVASESV